MNKPVNVLSIFLFLVILFSASSFAANSDRSLFLLDKRINDLLANEGEFLNVGIVIQDANTGELVYQKNPNRYYTPASNQKLFTAYAALQSLDLDFAYHTQLFADLAKVDAGVLHDNVYFKFSGDPTLTFTQLDKMISALAQAGIHKIDGQFIIDDSAFDQVTRSPGSTWDDKDFCYGSPLSAMIVDHNCVGVTLTPTTIDQPTNLVLPEQPQFMNFVNRTITKDVYADTCNLEIQLENPSTYAVMGCLKTSDAPRSLMLAINNPRLYTQSLLSYLLKKYKIENPQGMTFDVIRIPVKLLATESSPPLKTLITTMLKESDNTIADALFKTLGSLYAKQSGSWQNGHDAIRAVLLRSMQLDVPSTTLRDGAGTSRYNLVTPKQIVTLLRKVYSSPMAPIFVPALPISGIDGTLKSRMKTPEIMGRVHAKTGSEAGVTTLSGYLVTKTKRTLIFSILINGFTESPTKYKALEDKICQEIVASQ